jgi:hypothetical protein
LILRSIPRQQLWLALAEQYLDSDDKEVRNMATALFQHCGRLFTFIQHPGVEPAKIAWNKPYALHLRKIIFGNRNAEGETGRLLTLTQTCRMQGRNTLGYLTKAPKRSSAIAVIGRLPPCYLSGGSPRDGNCYIAFRPSS